MKDNFDEFIAKVELQLPDLVSNDDLIDLGLVAHHTALFRLREKRSLPFLKLSNARILYLKTDVIEWLRRSRKEANCLEGCVNDT